MFVLSKNSVFSTTFTVCFTFVFIRIIELCDALAANSPPVPKSNMCLTQFSGLCGKPHMRMCIEPMTSKMYPELSPLSRRCIRTCSGNSFVLARFFDVGLMRLRLRLLFSWSSVCCPSSKNVILHCLLWATAYYYRSFSLHERFNQRCNNNNHLSPQSYPLRPYRQQSALSLLKHDVYWLQIIVLWAISSAASHTVGFWSTTSPTKISIVL